MPGHSWVTHLSSGALQQPTYLLSRQRPHPGKRSSASMASAKDWIRLSKAGTHTSARSPAMTAADVRVPSRTLWLLQPPRTAWTNLPVALLIGASGLHGASAIC